MNREIPLYTLAGVRGADISTHYFSTFDKLGLSLIRYTRPAAQPTDAVLIIHGLTTSTDMFVMPEHTNLVTHLLDAGYSDVWTLDFRMSNRFPYNMWPHRFNFDDIALYDHPEAVRTIRAEIGPDRGLHVICHCLGSLTFMMALFGQTVEGITSVIANSVALTPRVPRWSKVKLAAAPFLLDRVMDLPYIDPRWGQEPIPLRGRLLTKVVDLFHPECDVSPCHMLSFMWGTGWPALYSHANLHEVTHVRGGDLYGATSVHYFRHVAKCVAAGEVVKYDRSDSRYDALPDDYFANAGAIQTPVLFMTGRHNHVFTNSNVVCFDRLRQLGCDWHELHVFDGYGHQDPFMGKTVHEDIFPTLVDFIDRHRTPATAATERATPPLAAAPAG